jgi:DNA ligase-1
MINKKLPILYSRNTIGGTQQWEIIVKGNGFFVREGLVNGKLTESKPTIVSGKNIDKINETSIEEQAFLEAKRKWDKKIEKGYHENVDNIDNESKYFEPMLAKKLMDRKDSIDFSKKKYVAERKYNGGRLVAMEKGLFTRNGKKYESCQHINEILKPLFKKHKNWIIDGEIYSHLYPFEKIMSLVRKIKPTSEDLKESEKIIQFHIYDGVVDDKSLGYVERFEIIKKGILDTIGKNKSLFFVEYIFINSFDEIEKLHDSFVREGYEGLMVRIIDAPYENKRSSNLLKYKKFFDEEFEIVDILEGSGNRAGMAGSLMLKTKDGKIFNSGIKGGEDYYRELWNNRKKLIKKYATVRYQNLSDKEKVPIFPVCIDIGRNDT